MAVHREQLFNELKVKIGHDEEARLKLKRFAEKVKEKWIEESPRPGHRHPLTKTGPYATGAYVASLHIRQSRSRLGRFLPNYEVYTNSPIAHFLEYGTKIDAPGTHSPWGRFTPTAVYAPAAKAAFHFGGTPD